MSEDSRDPVAMAAARLESAVEALVGALSRPRPMAAPPRGDDADMVPRAEVAAMAERLDATIARLRLALAEELRGEQQDGESQGE
ncbi:hypothetical protein E2C06_23305 [Dankookia rubra]|uniref:Uncharacterized protein n=1 Tax=Dankookia rubra TaxID=1442381 RepID=A0A4R5QCK4_9PROT|nr:hypothetical protein [Dankookia rubra]TDH60161.1 hypothetical protein E2C06_23305 [Dankookia rubra]